MPIFRALGLGVLILVLQALAPRIFDQTERTTIAFLRGAELSALAAASLATDATPGSLPRSYSTTPSSFRMPQVADVRR